MAVDRRTVLSGLASLSAVALIGTETTAAPPVFDPAAFVADLKAIGCRPYAFRSVSLRGVLGPWRYGIHSPEGRGFGRAFNEVMERWSVAAGDWPDKHDQVADYISGGAP